MKQQTLTGFGRYGKNTRQVQFLAGGLGKDLHRFEVNAGLADLFNARRRLLNG